MTRLVFWAIDYRVLVIWCATLIVAIMTVPGFASTVTLGLALDRAASMGLIAVGLTVLLAAGQIDLSSGAVFAVSGIVAVVLQPVIGIWPAAGVGMLAGLVAGAVNGFVVVGLGVNSLVATLATLLAYRAIGHWITQSQPMSGMDIMLALAISQVHWGVLTLRAGLFLVLILLLHVWLTYTVAGRNLIALGSSPETARTSGLRPGRMIILAFMGAGILAGGAGVLQSLSVNTGSPVFGTDLTLLALTAVVVGGTRLEGGRATALGTLGGVLTLVTLTTGMEFASVPAYVQEVVTGMILLTLIVLDRFARPQGAMT